MASTSATLDILRAQIAALETPRSACPSSRRNYEASSIGEHHPNEASGSDKAFKRIVTLVNASDKSERTLRSRLEKEGFGLNVIEESIARAKTYGIVDDMRYAEVLVRSRLNQGKGMEGVARELEKQNIDIYELPGWPEEFDVNEETEYSRALDVLKRNPPTSTNKRDGAYRKLVRKGYSQSVSISAARTWFEEWRLAHEHA